MCLEWPFEANYKIPNSSHAKRVKLYQWNMSKGTCIDVWMSGLSEYLSNQYQWRSKSKTLTHPASETRLIKWMIDQCDLCFLSTTLSPALILLSLSAAVPPSSGDGSSLAAWSPNMALCWLGVMTYLASVIREPDLGPKMFAGFYWAWMKVVGTVH